MSEHKLPQGWENKDIREVIPEEQVPLVSTFCKEVLRDSKKPGFNPDDIPRKAKQLLMPHKAAFDAVGTDVGFFAYWLQNAWNLRQFEAIVETLKHKMKKPVTLDKVLPPEGISVLNNFVNNCRQGTLIIEPGKSYVTLMFERVVEPYSDYILNKSNSGITDLHYLALVLCNAANIPAGECPS